MNRMPRKRPAIGKRQLKKMTRDRIKREFTTAGLIVEEQTAGSITYQVVKFADEANQVVAAIYGSLNGCASLWMKESAFALVKDVLPAETQVEDVEPFRRGFQWAIHFDHPESELITVAIEAAINAGKDRLTKTLIRRADDERRESDRAERAARKAETRRDWRTHDVVDTVSK